MEIREEIKDGRRGESERQRKKGGKEGRGIEIEQEEKNSAASCLRLVITPKAF